MKVGREKMGVREGGKGWYGKVELGLEKEGKGGVFWWNWGWWKEGEEVDWGRGRGGDQGWG